jgi:hypothetical protein
MSKRRVIDLSWRKTGPGHYEEKYIGFVIARVHSRRWQILDPDGREIYPGGPESLPPPRSRAEAENFFMPIPEEVGERVQVSDYEWQGSITRWMLIDFRLIDKKSGPPDITILPPITLPRVIRDVFWFEHRDSLNKAWLFTVHVVHPTILKEFSCRECGRPALENKLCQVCHWLEQDYHKTLYTS